MPAAARYEQVAGRSEDCQERQKGTVASRKNDDGTTSFITIDPTLGGLEFVVADKDGKRQLTTRDAQHEYILDDVASLAKN